MRWTCQRERHVGTNSDCPMPGTMWWIPHQGGIPCRDPMSGCITCRVGFFGWYTGHSSQGRVCHAEWHTRRTNTTRRTSNIPPLHASLPDRTIARPTWLLPASPMRACAVPRVSTKSAEVWVRLVPDVSTHSTRFGSLCQGRTRTHAGYSVIHAGVQSTPFGYP